MTTSRTRDHTRKPAVPMKIGMIVSVDSIETIITTITIAIDSTIMMGRCNTTMVTYITMDTRAPTNMAMEKAMVTKLSARKISPRWDASSAKGKDTTFETVGIVGLVDLDNQTLPPLKIFGAIIYPK